MNLVQQLKSRWFQLRRRERILLQWGTAVMGLALLWWVLLAPALTTLRGAAERQQRLDAQLQHMLQLQAQTQMLKLRPQISAQEAMLALEQSVQKQLGSDAQLQIIGAQATVTLKSLPADKLASWLMQARLNAGAIVTQARLKRTATVSPAAWSGTLVLGLPDH